jgi:ligand-binding sensor domain-containing protein
MKQIFTLPLLFLFAATHFAQNSKQGIPSYDRYFIETTDTLSSSGPRTITRNILQDKQGNFWFASWQGIMGYDGKIFTNYTLRENLIHFHVLTVFEDSKGHLWFGTVRGGMYRYDGKDFKLFTTNNGLAGNITQCMLEDKDGNLWFGTDNGVSRWDGQVFKNFTTRDGLSGDEINAIVQDNTGKIWFACTRSGINIYDGKNMTAFSDQNNLPFSEVHTLLMTRDGNMLIGSRDGLVQYDGQNFRKLLSNPILTLFEDSKGKLWLGVSEHEKTAAGTDTYYHVLMCSDGQGFTRIFDKKAAWDHQIFGISEDTEGKLWIGTMQGALRLDPSGVNHPCLKRTCKHGMPLRDALAEHEERLNTVLQNFKQP